MYLAEDPMLERYDSNLKKQRIRAGLTQKQLSELSGINIKSIAAYEQDPGKVNVAQGKTLLKISECLGCEIPDIMNLDMIRF